jgi:hypothetical protein
VASFEFRFVFYLATYLSSYDPQEEIASGLTFSDKVNNPKTLLHYRWRLRNLAPEMHPNISAMQHLVNVLYLGCLKKGDLISIALNAASIPLYFHHDQSMAVEEVVWKFTLLVLASDDLVPLVMMGRKLKLPSTGGGPNFIS